MKEPTATIRGHLKRYIFTYICLLLILHWITVFILLNNPDLSSQSWTAYFDLDREYNVPTYSNTVLLLSSGVISFVLAQRAKVGVQKLGWILFGILFSYLAIDEALILHEQLAEPVRKILDIGNSNPLYHAWVVPAIFIVGCMAIASFVIMKYYKQLKMFSDVLTYVVIMAGVVVALEIFGTFVYDNTTAYRLIMVPLEEIFELSMAALILTRLIRYLKAV